MSQHRIVNLGIGGAPTAQILQDEVPRLLESDPKLAIVWGGTNDMVNSRKLNTYDGFRANIEKILDILGDHGIARILVNLPPVLEERVYERHARESYGADSPLSRIQNANRILAEIASSRSIPLIDVYSMVTAAENEYIRNPENDGVHLVATGYHALAGVLCETIRKYHLPEDGICCMGDSLTYGVHMPGEGSAVGNTYPAYLKHLLSGHDFITLRGAGEIPVVAEAEVVVVGAGPGGCAAAVMAARSGADVIVTERYGAPGGMAFFGEVMPFMPNHSHGETLDRPVFVEWCRRMWDYLPDSARRHPYPGAGGFEFKSGLPAEEKIDQFRPKLSGDACKVLSKDAAMLAMEDMMLDSGVRLLYHHALIDVVKQDNRIIAAVFASKSGIVAVRGRIFVDSTGDGDLAARTGCPVECGNQDGACQPMTLCFKLGGIDTSRMPTRKEISALYDLARERGELKCIRHNVLFYFTLQDGTVHFNTTRVIGRSALDGLELSDAEIEGRRQLRDFLRFFRKDVPGFENAYLVSVAHHIGVRESRRVLGRVYQTEEDFTHSRKFPDGIARVSYRIDLHNPCGTGTVLKYMPADEYYEIRYPALIPQNCCNLLMGCRAISTDQLLNSSLRIMPAVCSIGQAAGVAAAMCIQENCPPIEIPGEKVRARLVSFGSNL